jgi:mono/diheme cytochrome c family protein
MRRLAISTALTVVALAGFACRETPRAELGKGLYTEYCAPCHGAVAKAGSAPSARVGDAPDLTRLAERPGGPVSRDELATYIDGRREIAQHGTREMPVWGTRLYEDYPQTSGTEAVREGTVSLILDYLQTIQVE